MFHVFDFDSEMALRLSGMECIRADYIEKLLKKYVKLTSDENPLQRAVLVFDGSGYFAELSINPEFFRIVPEYVRQLHKQYVFVFRVRLDLRGENHFVPLLLCYVPFGGLYGIPEEYVSVKRHFNIFISKKQCKYNLYRKENKTHILYVDRVYKICSRSIVAVNDVVILQRVCTQELCRRDFFEPMYFVYRNYPTPNEM